MLYGDEKLREMARSILPSSRRGCARRARRVANRHNRRQTRQVCRRSVRNPEFAETADFGDLRRQREIRYMVWERQTWDKLNHFERWALRVTADMGDDPGGRRARIRCVLPDGLIGWHACLHLDAYREFDPQRIRRWDRQAARARRLREWKARRIDRQIAISLLSRLVRFPEDAARLDAWMVKKHRSVVWSLGYAPVGGALVSRRAGPSRPPPLSAACVAGFVDRVRAADRRGWVLAPKEETAGLLFSARVVRDAGGAP